MAGPGTRAVAAALALVTLVSATGCRADDKAPADETTNTTQTAEPQPDDIIPPRIEPVGEPATYDIVPEQGLIVVVPLVGRIEAEPGAFSAPGRITVQTVQAESPPESFVRATRTGIEVTLDGTTVVSPVRIVFDDPDALASVAGAIPVALHQADNGPWEAMAVSLTEDRLPYLMVNGFSLYILGVIPIPDWVVSVADSIADYATQRTDPRPCAGNAPTWSSLNKGTTLVHLCAITNVDAASGAPRAEIQVQSNRRYYQFVTVPNGNDYLWVADQPDRLRQAIAKLTRHDWRRSVLLPGDGWFTAGYRQPAQTTSKHFDAEITYVSAGFSLVTSLLGLSTRDATSLAGIAFITGVCLSVFGGRLSWDAATDFLDCFISEALENLDDPDLALRSAMDFYGEQAYAKSAEQQLRKWTDRIRWIGRVIRIIGIGGLIQTAFWQLPDAFSAMGNDKPGRFTLTLTGGPTSSGPSPTQPSGGQPANPRIQLSQGGAAPQGYWYSVTLSGFTPGSRVTVACHDSVDRNFHTQTFTIGADGRASDTTLCYSADGPDHWVTGGGVESNHVTWGGGAPPPPPPPAGGGSLTVRRTSGPAGFYSTVEGANCPSGDGMRVTIQGGGQSSPDPGDLAPNQPFHVQTSYSAAPGTYTAYIRCHQAGQIVKTYTFQQTITQPTPKLVVTINGPVQPGSVVTVADGGGCGPYTGTPVRVNVDIYTGTGSYLHASGSVSAAGRWGPLTITLPAGFVGNGPVSAVCIGDNGGGFTYLAEWLPT